jgi:hypothetical protein
VNTGGVVQLELIFSTTWYWIAVLAAARNSLGTDVQLLLALLAAEVMVKVEAPTPLTA